MRETGRCLRLVLWSVLAVGSLGLGIGGYADYPWVHYFERPEMPTTHCAFSGAHGSVIVGTGDWDDTRAGYPPGSYWLEYWSEGIRALNQGRVDVLGAPGSTFVLDGALDTNSGTWFLMAEAVDEYVGMSSCGGSSHLGRLQADIGYRYYRFPVGIWSRLRDYRLAVLEGSQLVEQSELSDAIPGQLTLMASDPCGRVYVISEHLSGNVILGCFVSWWVAEPLPSLHVLNLNDIFPYGCIRGYPQFGPEGLAYFLIGYPFGERLKYAVLVLDPEVGDWCVFDETESRFLDSGIAHLFIDRMNVKWFGTEDGLVRFDGENWSRHTTENSGLPHNLVRQMAYDEVDETYYVVTSDRPEDYYNKPDWTAAFSTFSSRGEMIGEPVYCDWTPAVYQGAGDVWYLAADTDNGSTVYSYDHRTTIRWRLSDWVNTTSPYVGYIGPTSTGRTFLVTRTCVMIW